jgi:hypothetical protein
MPDDNKTTTPPNQPLPNTPATSPDAGHMPITEEMDSAKRTLPPIVPMLVAAVIVAIVVVVVVFSNHTKQSASVAITKIATADQQGNTMAAIQVKIDNEIDRPLWVKNITAEVETADGKKLTDTAAPSGEAPRYMAAFPPLEEAKADWLKEELKIPTKTSFTGVAIFSYPLPKTDFDKRKKVTMRIQLYDLPTLVATTQ